MAELLYEERSIVVFDKKSDDEIAEFILNVLTEDLKSIIKQEEDDPFFYAFYELTNEQLVELLKFSKEIVTTINLDKFYYVLQCTGFYDTDSKGF